MTDTIKTWQQRYSEMSGPFVQVEAMQAEIAELRATLAQQASPLPTGLDRLEPFVHGIGKAILREFIAQQAEQVPEAAEGIDRFTFTLADMEEFLNKTCISQVKACHSVITFWKSEKAEQQAAPKGGV